MQNRRCSPPIPFRKQSPLLTVSTQSESPILALICRDLTTPSVVRQVVNGHFRGCGLPKRRVDSDVAPQATPDPTRCSLKSQSQRIIRYRGEMPEMLRIGPAMTVHRTPTFSEHERYEIADKVINQLPESADIRGTAIENRLFPLVLAWQKQNQIGTQGLGDNHRKLNGRRIYSCDYS